MTKTMDSKEWPEVAVRHPLEAAEALSYFLFEIGALGLEQAIEPTPAGRMVTKADFSPTADQAALSEKLSAYFEELKAIFDLDEDFETAWRRETTGDWTEKWKEGLAPIEIGRFLVIKPSWCEFEARPGQRIIEIDPGMAFGTGRHASTYMCLEMIDDLLGADPEKRRILDLGTGSGILAMACAALGQDGVVAVDIDPTALPVAAENLERNRMDGAVRLICGEPLALQGAFELIVANITALDLIGLVSEFRRLAAGRARLILSGILTEQADQVLDAFARAGFSLQKRREQEEWTALLLAADF